MSNLIRDLLMIKYAPPSGQVFFEVPDGTGSLKNRIADAIAVEFYPSRGLEIHGYEFKASRSDWLRELKDASKADAFYSYCDRWSLIITDKSIVHDGELPPNWGLFLAGKTLKALKSPVKNEQVKLDRKFLIALLRVAGTTKERVNQTEVNRLMQNERNRNLEREKKWISDVADLRKKHDALLNEFAKYSGIDLRHTWRNNIKDIGEAVRFVLSGGLNDRIETVKAVKKQLSNLVTEFDRVIEKCKVTS